MEEFSKMLDWFTSLLLICFKKYTIFVTVNIILLQDKISYVHIM